MEVFEHENYIYGNMLSQDRGKTNLRKNASYRAKVMAQAFPSAYIANTTVLTPDGDAMDGWYFNEFVPAGTYLFLQGRLLIGRAGTRWAGWFSRREARRAAGPRAAKEKSRQAGWWIG